MDCTAEGCDRELSSRAVTGRCRYHPLPRQRDVALGEEAAPGGVVQVEDVPDAADPVAVNLWMRQMAIRGMSEHAADGPISPLAFDAFRRSLIALQDEARAVSPGEEGETVLDEVAARLRSFDDAQGRLDLSA